MQNCCPATVVAMLALGIIGWIAIGVLAGWTAAKLMGTSGRTGGRRELLGHLVVGIVGGLLGGLVLWLFGVDVRHGGIVFSATTCVAGACGLLFLVEKFRNRKA